MIDPQNPFLTSKQHVEDAQDEAQEIVAEQRLADAGSSQEMYNYSQKLLEQKEKELMESIAMNYGRIREVERELGNLQLQLKLTSGPKKHALELLRKKIEIQNEKVAYVRAKHTAAKATYERLEAELKQEEAVKEQLCGELNTLVQQAARAQMDKLEELKTTLEGLYSGMAPKQAAAALAPSGTPDPSGQQQQRQQPQQPTGSHSAAQASGQKRGPAGAAEPSGGQQQPADEQGQEASERQKREAEAAERRRREAEAAAARSRHVSLSISAGPKAPGGASGPSSTGERGVMAQAGPRNGGAGPAGRSTAGADPGVAAGTGSSAGGARAKAAGGTAGSQGHRFSGFDT